MKKVKSRLSLSLIVLIFILFTFCANDTVHYNPTSDNTAMSLIEQTWTEQTPGTFTITILEDITTADATPADKCSIDHVVKGGSRGLDHEEENSPVGCGGCELLAQAYVRATASGGILPNTTILTGTVTLGDCYNEDPYLLPYSLSLSGTKGITNYTINGKIESGNKLNIKVTVATQGGTSTSADYNL